MTLFLSFIQWWLDTAAKCEQSMIIDGCGDYSCEQGQTGGRLDCWSGSRNSWWVIKYEEIKIIAALRLLIIRHTIKKKDIFHIHSSVVNSNIEFVYKVYLNHEFNKLKGHQQSNLIEEVLNKDYFKGFIVKVVIFDSNIQKLSIVFLKMIIFLFTDL